jgi:hypothetical protein
MASTSGERPNPADDWTSPTGRWSRALAHLQVRALQAQPALWNPLTTFSLTYCIQYTLTRAGRRQLARETRDWDEATDILARFLKPERI